MTVDEFIESLGLRDEYAHGIRECIRFFICEERDACASLVESYAGDIKAGLLSADAIAAAIRARGPSRLVEIFGPELGAKYERLTRATDDATRARDAEARKVLGTGPDNDEPFFAVECRTDGVFVTCTTLDPGDGPIVYDGGLIAVETPADDTPRKINFREFL